MNSNSNKCLLVPLNDIVSRIEDRKDFDLRRGILGSIVENSDVLISLETKLREQNFSMFKDTGQRDNQNKIVILINLKESDTEQQINEKLANVQNIVFDGVRDSLAQRLENILSEIRGGNRKEI